MASNPLDARIHSLQGYVYENLIEEFVYNDGIYNLFVSTARQVAILSSEHGHVVEERWKDILENYKFLSIMSDYNHEDIDIYENAPLFYFGLDCYMDQLPVQMTDPPLLLPSSPRPTPPGQICVCAKPCSMFIVHQSTTKMPEDNGINGDFPLAMGSNPLEARIQSLKGYVSDEWIDLLAGDKHVYALFVSMAREVAILSSENGRVIDERVHDILEGSKFGDILNKYNQQDINVRENWARLYNGIKSYVNNVA